MDYSLGDATSCGPNTRNSKRRCLDERKTETLMLMLKVDAGRHDKNIRIVQERPFRLVCNEARELNSISYSESIHEHFQTASLDAVSSDNIPATDPLLIENFQGTQYNIYALIVYEPADS